MNDADRPRNQAAENSRNHINEKVRKSVNTHVRNKTSIDSSGYKDERGESIN